MESLSNELYSLSWPGSLGNPPASASASGPEPSNTYIVVVLQSSRGTGCSKLFTLKPFIPEFQQAGSHSPQAESSFRDPMVISVVPMRAGQGSSTELCLVAASADPHLLSVMSQNNSQILIMV